MGWAASWVARCAANCFCRPVGQRVVFSFIMSSSIVQGGWAVFVFRDKCVGQHVAQHIVRDGQ